jgi:ferredoxin
MLTRDTHRRDLAAGDDAKMARVRVCAAMPADIGVRVGESLLDGLLAAGVPFAYACQAGMCGECRCLLVSGEVEELPWSPGALGAGERARGIILACRARVLSDLVIHTIPACERVDPRADAWQPAGPEEMSGG